jgi:putative thioredoxin
MYIVILVALAFLAGFLTHRFLVRRQAEAIQPAQPESSYEAHVTTSDFDSMVLQTSRETPVLVDFYASWCAPCQILGPILSDSAKKYDGRFLLAKVDVDAEPALSHKYSITSMPTVMLFRDGKVVGKFVGVRREHAVRYFLAQHGVMLPGLPAPQAPQKAAESPEAER